MKKNLLPRFHLIAVFLVIMFSSLSAQTTLTYTNFPQQKWVMMGFPVTPENTNPDSIFYPYFWDAGTYWRFSRWDIGHQSYIRWKELDPNPAGDYTDWGDPATITPGLGYWMYQDPYANENVEVTGTLVPQTSDYYIPIDPPQGSYAGITMVANPFNYTTDWKNTIVNVTTGSESEEMTLEDANFAGMIDSYAYKWDIENGIYIPFHRMAGGVFEVWDGYWVEQIMPSQGEMIVYKVVRVNFFNDHARKFYNPKLGSKKDELGTAGVDETDRFSFIVSNAGSTCKIATINSFNKTTFDLNSLNTPVALSNGFSAKLVAKNSLDGGLTEFRFEISALTNTKNLNRIWFDFLVGATVQSPLHPSESVHYYTTFRTPYAAKSSESLTTVSLELKIPPINAGTKSLSKKSDHYPTAKASASERDWFIPISVFNADSSARDDYNGIGIISDASDDYDINDARNFTPMFSQYTDIYFMHDDINDARNYWFEHPTKVCYDVRADSSTKVWDMSVMSGKMPNTTFTLSWDGSSVTSDWSVELLDVEKQVTVDMKTQNSYTFTTSAASEDIKTMFQITAEFIPFSKVEEETQPVHFGLGANYPNPFNSTTVIPFVLEKPAWTTMTIYTMTGELIRTLSNQHLFAGKYELRWDGTDQSGKPVSSGIYMYRLISGDRTEMKKMSFVK